MTPSPGIEPAQHWWEAAECSYHSHPSPPPPCFRTAFAAFMKTLVYLTTVEINIIFSFIFMVLHAWTAQFKIIFISVITGKRKASNENNCATPPNWLLSNLLCVSLQLFFGARDCTLEPSLYQKCIF